jgi:hypothetical protein
MEIASWSRGDLWAEGHSEDMVNRATVETCMVVAKPRQMGHLLQPEAKATNPSHYRQP